jgi:hypothetical protein
MREFSVVRVTARNQLLLTGDGLPVDKPLPLLKDGHTVAKVLDTIARVDSPFYIASPLVPKPETLLKQTLRTKS